MIPAWLATLGSTAVGLLAAAAVARWQRRWVRRWQGPPGGGAALDEPRSFALLSASVLGAIAGAYLLQMPADLLGWAWRPETSGDARPLGGRTVVGGLLGGWIAVEWAKRRHGIAESTGDRFAAPLAAALACGRVGCALAGCCVGVACAPAWWAWLDEHGVARVPVAWIEAAFHAGATVLLLIATARAARRGRPARGIAFAAYMAAYAALRLILETVRPNPPLAFGLSWYQWLALALFVLAATITIRRLRPPHS